MLYEVITGQSLTVHEIGDGDQVVDRSIVGNIAAGRKNKSGSFADFQFSPRLFDILQWRTKHHDGGQWQVAAERDFVTGGDLLGIVV